MIKKYLFSVVLLMSFEVLSSTTSFTSINDIRCSTQSQVISEDPTHQIFFGFLGISAGSYLLHGNIGRCFIFAPLIGTSYAIGAIVHVTVGEYDLAIIDGVLAIGVAMLCGIL